MSLKKVIGAINKYKRFLITAHVGLEGDAIGGELALALLLKTKGKSAVIINEDNVPKNYGFLNNRGLIKPLGSKIKYPEAIFILDCSELSRCGKVVKIIPKGLPLIAIDHHISNSQFADINWVKPQSSSTGEMIYELYKAMGVPFGRASALCLYTAIMTDSGSFRYSTTSYKTHQAAAELLKFNISAEKIYQNVYQSNSYSDVLLLKEALNTLKLDRNGRIAWFKIDKDHSDSQTQTDQTDSVLDFARRIKGIEACFLLKRAKDKRFVRVNLRSRGKINVSKIAQYFGGGGHKNASGCTIKGTFAGVENKVLNRIKQELNKWKGY
ncbi:MAG: bifunctional oligoribonuclease/PAP phosphatase NrnA [Candidatus Omnitrophota bacterium]|nr:bifunctional oligoribonuclease/PAP phosphatase NrnA [Candidatus Omnitrophota bacterium]